MSVSSSNVDLSRPDRFLALVGPRRWQERLTQIRDLSAAGPRAGQAIRQRHGVELSLEKLRRLPNAMPSIAEVRLGRIAAEIPRVAAQLTARGRESLIEA